MTQSAGNTDRNQDSGRKGSRDRLVLVLMGGIPLVAATVYVAAKRESAPDVHVYANVQLCEEDAKFTVEQCVRAEREVAAASQRLAPNYTSASDCETDYGQGQCHPNGHGHSPGANGFLMWWALGGNRELRTPETRPLYRDRQGHFRTAGGADLGIRTGRQQVPAAAFEQPVRAVTVSRSGFGSTGARSYGGGG